MRQQKPLQRSLGLSWDVNTDNFLFQLSSENKPITRRGILSTINSLYDPLGFLAPVIIQGKLLLRKIVSETVDWDQPLTDETADEWKSWRDTLIAIETLRIPRTYVPYLSKTATKELHMSFSDASEKAIAAVAYLRTTDSSGEPNIGFILGKAKVAPTSGHTIPRLELSAAVLAVEITQTIMDNLDLHIDTVKFYTDSKVVLGYISNETRRFFIYVANRVEKIRKFSSPSQWNYVPTNRNPADSGTRSVPAHEIHSSEWLLGPKQLLSSEQKNSEDIYQLIDPEEDGEIRATVNVAKTFSTPEHKAGRSLTHDVLNTLMAEVSAIVNSRPLVPVSTDPENPLILTPAMLLTQKTDYIFTSDHLGEFDKRDLCLAEWRRVQALASVFWSRWRKEYLPLLQQRRKWTEDRRDLIEGDVILLKDKNICRTQWPVGIIVNSFKSSDEHVRKAEVRVIVNGKATTYTRPIVDMILLIENTPV
ncbi:Hypothetical predicted protein [Mytilus galloprovincialis]|uniref:DUF5641 domain-containing protein n=1 Tax=Mytilus galloprovincialis TaxID=29158 RepID=A0A8B6G342_MYTGA|nr:Hypothetical predicted protein [Mytilus galloprovincialis]